MAARRRQRRPSGTIDRVGPDDGRPRADGVKDLSFITEVEGPIAAAPHIAGTGVVYQPGLPVTMPDVQNGQTTTAGYAMVEMLTTLWAHRSEVGPGKVFNIQGPRRFRRRALREGSRVPQAVRRRIHG